MMAAMQHLVVVGVDFGTTYSAAAFATTTSPEHTELVGGWPTKGALVGAQVPSEIAYGEGDTTEFSWGYDINPKQRKVKWFKLGLESSEEVLKLPSGLTAVQVAEDFFTALYRHIMSTLYRRFGQRTMQAVQVNFVLTVPAIWSDAAKKKTEDAAARAGFANEHSLDLLSEPESAAVYTLKNLESERQPVQVGERVVVCDAGGGTVDLISYEVTQTHPRLAVIECAPGTGEFCGSTFIDQEFEKLFRQRMGKHYSSLNIVHRQHVVRNFELCKIAFRNDPGTPTFYVNVPTISDLEEAGVVGGNFEISREEMVQLFEPVVSQVLDLVRAQVESVSQHTRKQADYVLLVGGFGESEYLFNRVEEWARPRGMTVLQPREASTAIVRGAVLKGLEPRSGPNRTEVVRRARRSYGVPSNQTFIPGKHANEDLYIDPETGQKLARNQISWFIRKNQIMSDDQIFRHSFKRNFKHLTPWMDVLVSSADDIPPTRWDNTVHKHCTITSDLTGLQKSRDFDKGWRKWRRYYTANYELCMGVRNNNLTMALEYNGQQFGVANVEFEAA